MPNDYVEQLTYLMFLKMVEEQNQLPPPLGKGSTIVPKYSWEAKLLLRGMLIKFNIVTSEKIWVNKYPP